MTCPKCGSVNVVSARDEAPPAARNYVKCWACGKRWDQSGIIGRGTEGKADEDEPESLTRSADDLIDLVMNVARTNHSIQHKEKTKEKTMGKWSPEAREAHKERMQAIWAKKRGEKPRVGGGVIPLRPSREWSRRSSSRVLHVLR